MKIYSYDYETFYSKDYSIRDLGNYGYTHHQEFDAYMLSVANDEGVWVGDPKDFDWSLLEGALVVAHNAGFEQSVTDRLVELEIIPKVTFGALHDTADLAAYVGSPRSLAAACKTLLGVTVDKGMRDKAKGKRWKDMTPDFQASMALYGGDDALLERRLWMEFGHLWPEWERELSRMTREMCARGLPIELAAVEKGIKGLELRLWETRNKIPWATEETSPALSKKLLGEECRARGVAPPASMAKDSEVFEAWLKENGDKVPAARAMSEYRRVNMLLKKLQTMKLRTRPDGIMPIGIKYGGAHTMRDSGDTGFNPQNMQRDPVCFDAEGLVTAPAKLEAIRAARKQGSKLDVELEIDVRGMICAPEGFLFGVVDLSAIEPCALADLSGDEEKCQMLRDGQDPYEIQARLDGEYTDPRPLAEVDFHLRQTNKVKVLGMGYGAGPEKIQIIAKNLANIDLEHDEAAALVYKFRKRKFIPNLWKRLEADMFESAQKKEDYTMTLPSGREQRYRRVWLYGAALSAEIPRMGALIRIKWWGGSLVENLTQAACRDVFMYGATLVEHAGIDIRLRVHDELVALLPEDTAEDNLATMIKLMSTNPPWWTSLPLRATGHLCKRYTKS